MLEKYYNPGNLEISKGNPFLGECTPSKHKRFATYVNMHLGYRAMYKLLNNYIRLYNLNNIEKILHRYAPNNENHTENYIKFVSNNSGIDRKQILQQNDKRLIPIVYWMSVMENGVNAMKKFEEDNKVCLKTICEQSFELLNVTNLTKQNEIIKTFQIQTNNN